MRRLRASGLLWPTLLTAAGLVVLIGLGSWQMSRKAWKEALIAQIAERTQAAPIPLAEALRRLERGQDVEYTRVSVRGRFMADREAYVWAPAAANPGWHVYTPLETAGGRILLVNRGFVPETHRDPATRTEPAGLERELTGLLRKPEAKGLFSAAPNLASRLWFRRDLDGMAQALLGPARAQALQVFLDAERGAASSPGAPQGGVTRLVIANNHLQYAVTWYGLALTLAGVYVAFARQRWRGEPRPPRRAGEA